MRRVSLGEIILTTLRNYRWEISLVAGDPQVTEVYVCTNADYSAAPEGQKRQPVELSSSQRTNLKSMFVKKLTEAAEREEVEPESAVAEPPAPES